MVNDDSINEKIIEEETIKVMDDNDSINEKTPLQVFEWVRKDIKNKFNWEKRRIVWIFWKSHVTELCEKWIYFNSNYAYTRFEEFRTCSGEVLFTNEHKVAFSKNNAKTYIDVNDLEIFKDFSSDSKTIFKNKPVTVKIIEMINDKNINDICLKKIEEYACKIDNLYDSLLNILSKTNYDREKIYDLRDKCYNSTDVKEKDDILKKDWRTTK